MARKKEWSIKGITPDDSSTVRDWQFFRSIMEINRIIKEKNLSIKEIAKKIGIRTFTFRNYIYSPTTSRKTLPPTDIMKALFDHFGYDFFYVITGEKERKNEKDLKTLLEVYRKENEDLKKALTEKEGIIKYLQGLESQDKAQ